MGDQDPSFTELMAAAFERALEGLLAQDREDEARLIAAAQESWEEVVGEGALPHTTVVLYAIDAVIVNHAGGVRETEDDPSLLEILVALAKHHGAPLEKPTTRAMAVRLALGGTPDLAAEVAQADSGLAGARLVLAAPPESCDSEAWKIAQGVVQRQKESEERKRHLVGEAVRGVAAVGVAVVSTTIREVTRRRSKRARSPGQDSTPPTRSR